MMFQPLPELAHIVSGILGLGLQSDPVLGDHPEAERPRCEGLVEPIVHRVEHDLKRRVQWKRFDEPLGCYAALINRAVPRDLLLELVDGPLVTSVCLLYVDEDKRGIGGKTRRDRVQKACAAAQRRSGVRAGHENQWASRAASRRKIQGWRPDIKRR